MSVRQRTSTPTGPGPVGSEPVVPGPVGNVTGVGGGEQVGALRPRQPSPVSLSSLLDGLSAAVIHGGKVLLTGVASDSRLVGPGDLYLALPGAHEHGAAFASAALAAGAAAVLTDRSGAQRLAGAGLDDRVPVVSVADPRALMAEIAARLYRHPAQAMRMFGITGTNGKTTTSYLLDAALRAAGGHAGLIGTLGFAFDGQPMLGARTTVTTPEAPELQGLLAVMAERGSDAVTMEVSSHALAVGRVDAIRFDVAGFTNLGRDHLDFHGSEEAYFAAKASLFTAARTRHAVINVDDPRGPELVNQARREGIGVSTTSLDGAGSADFAALSIQASGGSSSVRVGTPEGELSFELGLPGRYNVHNAVTALAMLAAVRTAAPRDSGPALDLDLRVAVGGFAALAVPGRMQRVPLGTGGPQVYVDFAHTPQAVDSALAALAERSGAGRLICVVGCGGDRDPVKRGPMGAAAVRGADVVVVTDDNPRTEQPESIRAAVLAGAAAAIRDERPAVELIDGGDRRQALRVALSLVAESVDAEQQLIAVLGKGHEQGQQIGDQIWPFDDVQVVRELWAELAAGSPGPPVGATT